MKLKTMDMAWDLDHRVNQATAIIGQFMKYTRQPLIAFSGGASSIVLAHLLEGFGVRTAVAATPYWFDRTMEDVRGTVAPGLGLEVAYRDRLGPDWIFEAENRGFIWPTDSKLVGRFCAISEQATVRLFALGNAHDGVFYGRRKQENIVRGDMYETREGLKNCCPLIEWKREHVWQYIREKDLPFPSVYQTDIGTKDGCVPWNLINPAAHERKPSELISEFCPSTWERIKDRIEDAAANTTEEAVQKPKRARRGKGADQVPVQEV